MKKISTSNRIGISKYAIGVALGFSLFLPFLAMAQGYGQPRVNIQAQGQVIPTPIISSPGDISRIINAVLNWLSGIIFTISLIMLLYAAILYMTAGASEAALGKSKTVLIYAIVGLAIAILTYSFRPFLEAFFRGSFGS